MRLTTDAISLSGCGSLQQQLYHALRQQLCAGRWPVNAFLPSSRQLAADLSLSRNTVNQVLQQLVAEGYIEGQQGRGFQVVALLPDQYFHTAEPASPTTADYQLPSAATGTKPASALLQTGLPDIQAFPYAIWRKLLQRHSNRPLLAGFTDALGYLPLRQALAIYLRQSRQVSCTEDTILITGGAQQALFIAAKLVAKAGDEVLMESPGYPRLRQALALSELNVKHIDASSAYGLDTEQLPERTKAKALFITPGHQYPLGGIMPVAHRLALLQWAKTNQCWLVEDDYDSEYQYLHRPLPSLQGLAGGQGVLFAGSFSKTLFPALRLGYLVAPAQVIAQAAAIQQALHGDIAALPQAALADFITEGHFTRHLRRMRRHYQQKKQRVCQLLQQLMPECQLYALQAGLHLALEFPQHLNDKLLASQLQAQGLPVQPLSRYFFRNEQRCGLVFGITNGSDAILTDAITRLSDICRQFIANHSHIS